VEFEVTPVPFVPFQSLRTLDLDRLARARHAVVELGQFESNRCKRTVRAVIKAGQVTEVKVDPCRDVKAKVPPEFARLISRARRALKRSTPPTPRLPMSVARFFVRQTSGDIEIGPATVCLTICIDFFGTRICTVCCVIPDTGRGEQTNCGSIIHPF
jgi:hypothetical protein